MTVADRYTRTAMVLHWVMAVLIVGNVLLGLTAEWFPDGLVRPLIDTHKSIGITVLGLAVLRLLWRVSHRPPAMPASYPRVERAGAHAAHILLYVLVFALPLSGWIHDSAFAQAAAHPLYLFGLVPWPRIGPIMAMDPAAKEPFHALWFQIHVALSYALYVLLALHILGALKHQFVDKEPEFRRMMS